MFAFAKQHRLLTPAQYKRVFSRAKSLRLKGLLLLYRPNDQASARLGLVIAKRVIPLAVERNRVKRVIRECFRQQVALREQGIDIIVMSKPGLAQLSNTTIATELSSAWQKLIATSAHSP